MTQTEWRKNGERLSMAGEALAQPVIREMLWILETTEHPARERKAVSDGFGATIALGEIQGFERAIAALKLFAVPLPAPPEEIPMTWNAEEKE